MKKTKDYKNKKMKEEIIILEQLPTILTKDEELAKQIRSRPVKEDGEVLVLPKDAILVIRPTYDEIKKERT